MSSSQNKLTIAVAATKSYLFAWQSFIRAILAAASYRKDVVLIVATDESKEAQIAIDFAKKELPEDWEIILIKLQIKDDKTTRYKEEAQLRIAALQGACFSMARKIRADFCWVVESDTIVPADALRVLEWTLNMPTGDGNPHYDIAAATYPNGLFLGGFGTPQNQICEDFLPHERKLKPRLKIVYEECEKRLKEAKDKKTGERESMRMVRLRERIKHCPPDGNVWEVIAKYGWRRRGWMDAAYPGIGRGAIVPSDWCGLGCTLLSKRALAHAEFTGYEGKGTQDLFLCWNKWYPAGLKIACVPHIACDHIKRKPDDAPKDSPDYIHFRAYHETDGEHKNHLRVKTQPYIQI